MHSPRDVASLALHHASALLDSWSGRTRRRLERRSGTVAILMYHRVLDDHADASLIEPGMYVRASAFERQLGWVRSQGTIRTLGEVVSNPPSPNSAPQFVLTFDDGWRDNLTVGLPILDRHGARATIFAVRDWSLAGTNGEGEFLSPDELRELADRGFEIGAHTASHPRLPDLGDPEVENEMRASREAVEQWTGRPCRVFAYPYGAHEDRTVEVARRVFDASVSVGGGWWAPGGDTARMPRIGIHQDMASTRALFAARVAEQA